MTPKTFDRILLVAALVMAAMLILAWRFAGAQGNYEDESVNVDASSSTELIGGDTDVTTLGLSQSLGDVDIAGCIVTTQFGIIIFQKQGYEYDVFCLADKLDQAGKYADAAIMRCQHPDSAKLFGGRCLSVMNFEPGAKPEPAPRPTPTWASEEQVAVRAQEEEERDHRLEAIEQRLDREASARRAYSRKLEAEKEVERQRASEALKAYKAATQNDE